jgi:hypothetical protein
MLSPEQKAFASDVYRICEQNYENGGDIIIESFTPEDIVKEFKSLRDVKDYILLRLERALNSRWGEDTDPQLLRYRRAAAWINAT